MRWVLPLLGPELEQKGDQMNSNPTGRAERRSILLPVLSALFALVLVAACSDGDADRATGDAVDEAAETEAAPEPAESDSDADAAAVEEAPQAAPEPAESDSGADAAAVEEAPEAAPEPAESDSDGSAESGAGDSGAESDSGAGSETAAETDDAAAGSAVQRIVSISPTGTEMLFAIGAGDRVMAVDRLSNHPAGAPVTDLDGWNPNIEAIASYDPDLVVLQASGDVVAGLEALGIEVWGHAAPSTFEDVYAQIEQLGEVAGQSVEAAEIVAEMRSGIAELVAAAPDASGLSYYHELDNTLYSVTSSTFIGQVYALFGLNNVADPADADGSAWGYPQLSDEYLVDADPDVIFLADTRCCGQNAQTVAERPGWDEMTAVQSGRIVELDDDIASRWGPRLLDFIEAISEVIVSIGATS